MLCAVGQNHVVAGSIETKLPYPCCGGFGMAPQIAVGLIVEI